MKTLILGIGNPILTDDGVGILVAEAVEQRLRAEQPGLMCGPAAPATAAVGLGGLALMEAMLGYERVIVIDAMLRANATPGRLHQFSLAELEALSPTEHSSSPHDTSLTAALALGRSIGLPLPAEVVIFAVEVSNILDFAETPTAAVAAAIPQATTAVVDYLDPAAGR
jgi:hydrogenase maturation protease